MSRIDNMINTVHENYNGDFQAFAEARPRAAKDLAGEAVGTPVGEVLPAVHIGFAALKWGDQSMSAALEERDAHLLLLLGAAGFDKHDLAALQAEASEILMAPASAPAAQPSEKPADVAATPNAAPASGDADAHPGIPPKGGPGSLVTLSNPALVDSGLDVMPDYAPDMPAILRASFNGASLVESYRNGDLHQKQDIKKALADKGYDLHAVRIILDNVDLLAANPHGLRESIENTLLAWGGPVDGFIDESDSKALASAIEAAVQQAGLSTDSWYRKDGAMRPELRGAWPIANDTPGAGFDQIGFVAVLREDDPSDPFRDDLPVAAELQGVIRVKPGRDRPVYEAILATVIPVGDNSKPRGYVQHTSSRTGDDAVDAFLDRLKDDPLSK